MALTNTLRIFISFWLFGLINNSLYVVILSAASDLVGPSVPKALVLLFDVLPSFIIKLSAPFFIKSIGYNVRIFMLICLSFIGMVILSSVSNSKTLLYKMLGITLASLSSGLGEVTFLSLTHYYNKTALNAWSSGTGFAGIFGSFNFMVMTTWLSFSTKTTLFSFSVLPFAFLAVFWKILPVVENVNDSYISNTDEHLDEETTRFLDGVPKPTSISLHIHSTLDRIKPLVFPYMIPLTTVYFAEYLINQGISPTLLFPLDETPFKHFRDIYVTYATLYQVGVFISRSSAQLFRIKLLYIPSLLQNINLVICIVQSLWMVIPSIYIMFLLIFYEGLLGGASYVNTFMLISEQVAFEDREFALGAVSISDSLGVGIASLFGMWMETSLCKYQVSHGRDWCTKR